MNLSLISELFKYSGDLVHILSKVILAYKIETTKSCSGLSFKTQFLYLVVFVSRYFDLFDVNFHSLRSIYMLLMKVIFISFQCVVVYLIRVRYYDSYDKKTDVFKIRFLVFPSLVIAMLLKPKTSGIFDYFNELLYVFSLILESVCILPQLVQIQEDGECEKMTSTFIFLLGLYRILYTMYFITKKMSGLKVGSILVATGIVQGILYVDFYMLYFKYLVSRRKIAETN